jgi:hypothetical protein
MPTSDILQTGVTRQSQPYRRRKEKIKRENHRTNRLDSRQRFTATTGKDTGVRITISVSKALEKIHLLAFLGSITSQRDSL